MDAANYKDANGSKTVLHISKRISLARGATSCSLLNAQALLLASGLW
jgi:hypothetical protein